MDIQTLACVADTSTTILYRRSKEGAFRTYQDYKALFDGGNKRQRLQLCPSMIKRGIVYSNPMFLNIFNYVHIDEKIVSSHHINMKGIILFYITEKSLKA